MSTRVVAERIQRAELLAQTFGFGIQALQQHLRFGQAQVLGGLGLGRAELFFAARLGAEFLFQHLGVGQAVFFLGSGLRFDDTRLRQTFLLLALGFGDQTLGLHASLGQAFLLLGRSGDFTHLGVGQTRRSALGFDAFGQLLLGLGALGRGFQLGLGQGIDLDSLVLGTGLVGFGLFDLAHQLLLGFGLGIEHGDLLEALGLGDFTYFLDALFFLRHGLLDRHPLANHRRDVLALFFQRLFLLDALQLDFTLAGNDFQLLGTHDLFLLDRDRTLAVLLRHFDFARGILLTNVDLFLSLDTCLLGLQTFFFLDLQRLGLLTRLDGFDLTLLTRLGIGLLTFQSQGRLAGFDVLLLDRQLFVALQLVGNDVLRGGQLGDLADTFGVEDVARVQRMLGRLLQVVDGHVFQHVAVEVVADHLDDTITEFLAILEQLDEIELLADGLQRLGELGVEQLVDRRAIGGTFHADGLGHLEHVFLGLVDAQVEGHGDVGTHVVAADQAVLATTVHFQSDQGDLHELLEVDHRVHQGPGEVHLGRRAHVVDDQRGALRNLDVERLEQGDQGDHEKDDQPCPDDEGNDVFHYSCTPLLVVQAGSATPRLPTLCYVRIVGRG